MRAAKLYLETTTVPAERTAAEICQELVKAGPTQIATSYDGGRIVGLRWTLRVAGQELLFAMPARVEPVYKLLRERDRAPWRAGAEDRLRERAERIAWRQLLRWVQIQIAMIQTGMVDAAEVFLPYMEVGGRTLYRAFADTQFKRLPPPS